MDQQCSMKKNKNNIKGVETNLYTFIQICFHTLYMKQKCADGTI